MALGKQFENTAWEDPETGIVHSWTRETDEQGVRSASPTYRQNASDEELSGHQMSLFHPAMGTGLRDDPLVPISRRKNAAARALGVEKVDPYLSRAYSMLGNEFNRRSNPISKKTAIKDMVGAREALVDSFAPIEEIDRMRAPIAVNPRGGTQYAEEHNGRIRLSRIYNNRRVEIPERQVPVTSASNEPIHNPNFWKWYDKHGDNLTLEGKYAITVDPLSRGDNPRTSMWHNPETGHTGTYQEVRDHIGGVEGDTEGTLRDLESAGYFPNIFPGKSKPSSKHSADDFSAETESWETGNFNSRSLHARWKPGDVTFRTEPARTEVVRGPASVNEQVLMHEIGHTRDPIVDDPYTTRTHITQESKRSNRYRSGWSPEKRLSTADPVNEGLADGYADRFAPVDRRYRGHYAGHGGSYEDFITDPSTEMESGYGVENTKWKNRTHRALYVAARAHARSSDTAVETGTINRDELMRSLAVANWDDPDKYDPKHNRKHLEEGNTMALGYMYQNMPHIRAHLEHHGLDDVAKKAHSAYLERSGEEHYEVTAKREAHYAAQRKNPKAKMWELPPLPPGKSDVPIPGTEKW